MNKKRNHLQSRHNLKVLFAEKEFNAKKLLMEMESENVTPVKRVLSNKRETVVRQECK